MDENGPFWPEEVRLGPFRSANCTLAIPEYRSKTPSIFVALDGSCNAHISKIERQFRGIAPLGCMQGLGTP